MDFLSSTTNPKVKYLIKLRDDSKHRSSEKKFFIQGFHIVKEAINKNIIHEIFVTNNVFHLLDLSNLLVTIISEEIANKIASTKSNQGIFAICDYQSKEIDFNKNILVLDAIQDPGNMGTLIRSAAAFGFENIIASTDCVSFLNDKVLRSTQGMIFNLNLINNDLFQQLNEIKANNYQIIGTFLNNEAVHLDDFSSSIDAKICLIVGNEGNGISPGLFNFIDTNLKIKMNDYVESLNVGVAGSLIMHHFKQKM